jgi:hypothetical protein
MGYKQSTYDGRRLDHDDMTHQHLSNCVWHFRIWSNAVDSRLTHFFETLERRFNGELLPFRPPLRFRNEIEGLYKADLVVPVDEYKSNIVYKGVIIGEIFNSQEAEIAFYEREAYNRDIDELIKE